jgi:polyferredoxin
LSTRLRLSARGWRRLRQGTQVLALLLFLGLFVYTNAQRQGRFWADIFSRLDPLLMLSASLAGPVLLAGLALAGLTLLLTLLFGRTWCGWLCPLGTVLEWLGPRRARRKAPPESWRAIKYLLLLVLLVAALLGSQAFVFLDPITILNRTLTTAIWPGLRYAVVEAEAFLYRFDALWPALDAVHGAVVRPLFLDVQPVFGPGVLLALLFAGLVALNWWAGRFWCRYLCPLGGLLGWLSRLALVRREVSDACSGCARCTPACPTATIDPKDGYRSDPAECIVCLDCLVDCPKEAVAFRWQFARWRPARRREYDPSRRQALVAVGATVTGVADHAPRPGDAAPSARRPVGRL